MAVPVAASLALHVGLGLIWATQRAEPPRLPAARPVDVLLVTRPPPALDATETTPDRRSPAVAPTPVRARATIRPTAPLQTEPAPTQVDPPLAMPGLPSPGARPQGVDASFPGASIADGALGRALAVRAGCREPDRLTPAERARCDERLTATPEVRLAEMNPHARIAAQVQLMAGVRRAENSTRPSCEAMRNLDTTCINLLPDNLPNDSVLIERSTRRTPTDRP